MTRKSLLLVAFGLCVVLGGCGKKDSDDSTSETPAPGAPGGNSSDASGRLSLALNQPRSFSGRTIPSRNELVPPSKDEFFALFRLLVERPVALHLAVSGIKWGSECGQVDGPYAAYGVADSQRMSVLDSVDSDIPETLPAGSYEIMLNFLSEKPCAVEASILLSEKPAGS